MGRILHGTSMIIEASDPTIDKVCIKTMLQCDRGDQGIRIFAGIYNAEFESLLYVLRFLATGGATEYISMLMN